MRTIMSKLVAVSFCIATTLPSYSADKEAQAFLAHLKTSRVEMAFKFSSDDESLPVSGSGTLTAQGNCFSIKTDDGRVYCNGKSIVTIDDNSKEVVVEDANLDFSRFVSRLSVKTTNGRVSSASYKIENGKSIVIDIPYVKWLEATSLSDFEFDLSSLDKGYLVTDLRSF